MHSQLVKRLQSNELTFVAELNLVPNYDTWWVTNSFDADC